MAKETNGGGVRIGDWFLWIDCEKIRTGDYKSYPLVRLRKAISGGDIITAVVGSRAMAAELRKAADLIERVAESCDNPMADIACEASG